MLLTLAGYDCLFRDIGFCLFRVAWHAKQLQVAFPVFPAVDERNGVIVGRA
jgi:hypothetical protein